MDPLDTVPTRSGFVGNAEEAAGTIPHPRPYVVCTSRLCGFQWVLDPVSRAHRRTQCRSTKRPESAWAAGGCGRGGARLVTCSASQWGARPRPSLLRAFAAPAASRERSESKESGERRAPSSAAGSAGCGQERWTRGRIRSRAARARPCQATPSPGGRRAMYRGRLGPPVRTTRGDPGNVGTPEMRDPL